MIAQFVTTLGIGWLNGNGPTAGPTVIEQIMRTLGIIWPDVIFLVLLLAFCSLLSVLAYQQAINHIVWFIYPLVALLIAWSATHFFGWRIPEITASVGLPLFAAGLIGVHFSIQSKRHRTSRIEYFRRIIEDVTVNPDREISREVCGLAEIVLNGSKAEVIGSSRTLASMIHVLTESERAFLLRLMTFLLARDPSWRLQAANDVIVAIKTNGQASMTGRFVDMAYRDRGPIRELLTALFNLEELKNLCIDMGIDYDDLKGEGKEAKARELVEFCYRDGRLGELLGQCREKRPRQFDGLSIAQPPLGQSAQHSQNEPTNSKLPLPRNVVTQPSPNTYVVTCSYCKGGGLAPDYIYSNLEINSYRSFECPVCGGKGALRIETADTIITHIACQGTGRKRAKEGYTSMFYKAEVCPDCKGLGVIALSGELEIIK